MITSVLEDNARECDWRRCCWWRFVAVRRTMMVVITMTLTMGCRRTALRLGSLLRLSYHGVVVGTAADDRWADRPARRSPPWHHEWIQYFVRGRWESTSRSRESRCRVWCSAGCCHPCWWHQWSETRPPPCGCRIVHVHHRMSATGHLSKLVSNGQETKHRSLSRQRMSQLYFELPWQLAHIVARG